MNCFTDEFKISPYKNGLLDGLTFAVKDLIDIAGYITGCGNPTWKNTHPQAVVNAVCVEQLLLEGAACLGKTITDELAFSLLGENFFYGTPKNPKAPDRIPGGSSSGSASAVAQDLVDFALGTDTGGSVRVPAANCGIWGLRPSHGQISIAGVTPFAPSFDTVGVLAKNCAILKKVISAFKISETTQTNPTIYILEDIFQLCDENIRAALQPTIQSLKNIFPIEKITLANIAPTVDCAWLHDVFTQLQNAEIWSSLGSWIEANAVEFGPITKDNFNFSKNINRLRIQECSEKRLFFSEKINAFFKKENNILCFPTTAELAPKLKSMDTRKRSAADNYYVRALGMNAISGLSKTPQISMPLANFQGVPVGLSLLAGFGKDLLLCETGDLISN